MGPGGARERASRAGVGPPLRFAIGAILLAIAGCSPPPPAPPTLVNVQVSATAAANPTSAGQGAPVAVRIYQLASRSAFEQAEFFPLFNADAATLGPDLVKKDEFLLAPGQQQIRHLAAGRPGARDRRVRGLSRFPVRDMARCGRHSAAPDHHRYDHRGPRRHQAGRDARQARQAPDHGLGKQGCLGRRTVPAAAASAAAGPLHRTPGPRQHHRPGAIQLWPDPTRNRHRSAHAGQIRRALRRRSAA